MKRMSWALVSLMASLALASPARGDGLSPKDVEKSAPLFQHKDQVVLAIELQ